MKKALALFTALLMVFLLASCGPPSAPADSGSPEPASEPAASEGTPAEEAAEPAADGPLEPAELVFWDLRKDDPGAAMIDGIIAAFEEANPGVPSPGWLSRWTICATPSSPPSTAAKARTCSAMMPAPATWAFWPTPAWPWT